jgi:hypothetical protein
MDKPAQRVVRAGILALAPDNLLSDTGDSAALPRKIVPFVWVDEISRFA